MQHTPAPAADTQPEAVAQTAQPQNCPAWQHLQQLAKQFAPSTQAATPQVPAAAHFDLRQAFASNPQRTAQLSLALHDAQGELLYCDYSKAHINGEVLQALLHLAEQTQVSALRDAMFSGAAINTSEQRQVMHWLLRVTDPADLPSNLLALWHEVDTTRRAFLDFAESIRADAQITDIVNIGIGGSDLGPCMAVQALYNHALPNKRLHFVSNIDAHDLQQVLQQVQRQHTLFIIASKSFTTLETMFNARTALDWFCNGEQEHNNGNTPDIARHFVGITTNQQAAAALGIRTTFGFWDWVGGRYSLWSAIGLPLAIAIGAQGFMQLLAGARAVDKHFAQAAPQENLPLLLGLLEVWETSFLHYNSRCLAPYHACLQRLPAYLQQLVMESNGKSCTKSDQPTPYPTAAPIWGEPGSNGQHAFFQLLHQGTQAVSVEFIAVRKPEHPWEQHHNLLLVNAIAQAQALMQGREHTQPQHRIAGNRPSTFITLPELSPRTLGALLALYEHRVFVCGAVWNINSFDQWGVELGKVLAQDLMQRINSNALAGLDTSSASLLQRLLG